MSGVDKEQRNRSTARLAKAKVGDVGYVITHRSDTSDAATSFTPSEEGCLAGLEHDIWLRSHLMQGYEWGKKTNDAVRLHSDVAPIGDVKGEESEIDRRIVKSIPNALWERGYVLRKVLRVGVTGHRILTLTEKIEKGIEEPLTAIERKFVGRPLCLVSPLAEGADCLVARGLLRRKNARLLVLLPMPSVEYMKDFELAESKEEFRRLLDRADEVIEMPPAPTRNEAYEAAGLYVLDHCDVLIAVWDGQGAQGQGGTGGIVARARQRRLPIAWVHAGNRKPGTTEPTSLGEEQGVVTFENF